MKKLCYTAFVAFWACIATLLALRVVATDGEPEQPERSSAGTAYTLEQVADHGDEASCWLIIDGAVYDVTNYLPMHPSPPSVLLEWCGKEATEGMRTKGYGRDHSDRAWQMLEKYKIGDYTE